MYFPFLNEWDFVSLFDMCLKAFQTQQPASFLISSRVLPYQLLTTAHSSSGPMKPLSLLDTPSLVVDLTLLVVSSSTTLVLKYSISALDKVISTEVYLTHFLGHTHLLFPQP